MANSFSHFALQYSANGNFICLYVSTYTYNSVVAVHMNVDHICTDEINILACACSALQHFIYSIQ